MTEKKISRRGFLKKAAACAVVVPFVPSLIGKSSEVPVIVGVDKALEGSDNTSIWNVRFDKDGSQRITMAEIITKENELLRDLEYKEVAFDEGVGRRTIRQGLPKAAWRKLNA